MPNHNNATRRKARAMAAIWKKKAHTANEKRRQLREAGVIERFGPNANINAILKAENESGKWQEAEWEKEKEMSVMKKANAKPVNANAKPVNANTKPLNANAKKPVKKWAPVNTSHLTRRR